MELLYTAHVPPGPGPHPTVIALHGWGANAHDLLGLAPYLHGGRALVLCPQGPVAFEIDRGIRGYGWFPLAAGRPPDAAAFAGGRAAVAAFLEEALRLYPIDPRKLVLMGFSQGGVMAYDAALRAPDRFAGLVALSSWLPAALVEEVPRLPAHAQLPVFVSHGTDDPMIPVERARESRDHLRALGVPTTYCEYAMGHEIRAETLGDLVGWLEDKVFRAIQIA